ncbi:MAG: hypothetical protein RBT64_00465 [Trichloromonas sp.]|nr:hypothetical protein [Trichloromonas sp.]
MINNRLLRKFFATALLFTLVGMRLSSVSHDGFVVPVQDVITKVSVMLDGDTKPQAAHCKVKGQGMDLPVPCADFVLTEKLQVSRLSYPSMPKLVLPEGHTTIFIPPA